MILADAPIFGWRRNMCVGAEFAVDSNGHAG